MCLILFWVWSGIYFLTVFFVTLIFSIEISRKYAVEVCVSHTKKMYLSNTTICTCVYIHIHSLWCPSWEFSMEKLYFIFSSWDYMNTLFLHKLSPMNFSEHIVNLLHVNIIMTTNGSLKVLLFHLCILISILQWREDISLFD